MVIHLKKVIFKVDFDELKTTFEIQGIELILC